MNGDRTISVDNTLTIQTSNGVLGIVIALNADLALDNLQTLTIRFEEKLAKAFSAIDL